MGSGPGTRKSKSTGVTIPIIQETEPKSGEFEKTLRARIAVRAHQIFEQSETGYGQDVAHWLQAESELVSEVLEVWESGSWITVHVPLPKAPPEAIRVLVRRDRALVCAEGIEIADDAADNESRHRVRYLSAKWPNEVDPSTASAYLKNGIVTLSARHASPGS
jgi:HSP20 family molecular chaperone IbpA